MFWNIKRIFRKKLLIQDGKELTSKFKMFFWSILISLFILITILAIFSSNPFLAFENSFQKIISSFSTKERMVNAICIFGLSGLAIAISFKAGIFNLGVSGQMMIGSLTSGIFALYLKDQIPNGLGQITILLIAMASGALFATLASLLKNYFNVNVVVSTILLNWIAFYIHKSILDANFFVKFIDASSQIRTINFHDNYLFKINNSTIYPVLIIFLSFAFILWIIFKKTSLGFKMIMVGKNPDVARHAGININRISNISMAFSGAIAGVLGVVIFFAKGNSLQKNISEIIPVEGFDGIAISLLAFSNPIAIIPVAIIFGVWKQVIVSTNLIDDQFLNLSFGVLMYLSAIHIIFDQFKIKKFIIKTFKEKEYSFFLKERKIMLEKNHIEWYNRYSRIKFKTFWMKSKKQNFEKELKNNIKNKTLKVKIKQFAKKIKLQRKNIKEEINIIKRKHHKSTIFLKNKFDWQSQKITKKIYEAKKLDIPEQKKQIEELKILFHSHIEKYLASVKKW